MLISEMAYCKVSYNNIYKILRRVKLNIMWYIYTLVIRIAIKKDLIQYDITL